MWPSSLTLVMTLTVNFQSQIWNLLYFNRKWRLPRNENQTCRLNFMSQMWPMGLTLAMTLTLNFQDQIGNFRKLMTKWSDCHRPKWTYRLNTQVSIVAISFYLGRDLDLWYSRFFLNSCISLRNGRADWCERKWSNLWPMDLWPHACPWPWLFMVKFWHSCISGMGGSIDIEQKGWEPAIHNHDHDLLVTKVRCKTVRKKNLADSDCGDFKCRRAD